MAAGCLQLYAILRYQPFFSRKCNQYHAAWAMVFGWAALNTLLAELRDKPEDEVESYAFLLTLVCM